MNPSTLRLIITDVTEHPHRRATIQVCQTAGPTDVATLRTLIGSVLTVEADTQTPASGSEAQPALAEPDSGTAAETPLGKGQVGAATRPGKTPTTAAAPRTCQHCGKAGCWRGVDVCWPGISSWAGGWE